MNSHSQTEATIIQKSSVDVNVYNEGVCPDDGSTLYASGNDIITVKIQAPKLESLLISQEQPTNAKWTGIYSLSNSLSHELAKNKLINVDIDFKKRSIQGSAPLEINDRTFTLNAHFDDAGNISEMFDIDTDSLVSRNVLGKIYQNYIYLELHGVGSNSVQYVGGLIAFPPPMSSSSI